MLILNKYYLLDFSGKSNQNFKSGYNSSRIKGIASVALNLQTAKQQQ